MPPGAGGNIVLDEHMDENYEPTTQEIEEYAEWLGMNLDSDRDLFWIAREGLKAPLPKPWKPCQAEDGEIFYFNFETGESVWDHPCDEHYKKLFQEKKKEREDGGSKKDKKDKKDKKEKKDKKDSADKLDSLPAPGESLFGMRSRTGKKVIFDCKPKTAAAKAGAVPMTSSMGMGDNLSDTEKSLSLSEREQELQEKLQSLESEFEEKKRSKLKEQDAEMSALERQHEVAKRERRRQLEQELERDLRKTLEGEVREKLKPWAQTLEETLRKQRMEDIEQDVENKLQALKAEKERWFEQETAKIEAAHKNKLDERQTALEQELQRKASDSSPMPSAANELAEKEQAAKDAEIQDLQKKVSEQDAELLKLRQAAATEAQQLQELMNTARENARKVCAAEVEQLKEQMGKLKEELKTANAAEQSSQAELQSLKEQLSEKVSKGEALERQNQTRTSEVEQLQEQLTWKAAEVQAAEDARQRSAAEVQQVQEQLAQRTAEARAAEDERRASSIELETLKERLAATSIQAGEAETSTAGEIQKLKEELAAARAELKLTLEDREANASQLQRLTDQLTGKNAELQALGESRERAAAELQRLAEQLAERTAQMKAADAAQKTSGAELQRVKDELASLMDLHEAGEESRKSAARQLQFVEEDLAEKEKALEKMQTELSDAYEQLQQAKAWKREPESDATPSAAVLQELDHMKGKLERQSREAQSRIGELESTIASKNAQINQQDADMNRLREELRRQEREKEEAKSKSYEEAKARKREPESEATPSAAPLQELDHMKGKLERQSREAQSRIGELESTIASKNAQINQLDADMNRLREELRRQEREKEEAKAKSYEEALLQRPAKDDDLAASKEVQLQETCRTLKADVDRLNRLVAQRDQDLRQKEQLLSQEKIAKAAAESAEARLRAEGDRLHEREMKLETEVAQLRVRMSECDQDAARLQREFATMELKHQNAQAAQQSSEEKLMALRAEVSAQSTQLTILQTEKGASAAEASRWQQNAEASGSELQKLRYDMQAERVRWSSELQTEREAWQQRERLLQAQGDVNKSTTGFRSMESTDVQMPGRRHQREEELDRLKEKLVAEQLALSQSQGQSEQWRSECKRLRMREEALDAQLKEEQHEWFRASEKAGASERQLMRMEVLEASLDSKARALGSELRAACKEAADVKQAEHMEARRGREEVRLMEARVAKAEDDTRMHEERCHRLSLGAESASKALRSELHRTDTELQESMVRLRSEVRSRDEVTVEFEEQLRMLKRQLQQKEVKLAELREEQATQGMLEERLTHLDQKEQILRAAERALHRRQIEVEAEAERVMLQARKVVDLQSSGGTSLGRQLASTAPATPQQEWPATAQGGEGAGFSESQVTRKPSEGNLSSGGLQTAAADVASASGGTSDPVAAPRSIAAWPESESAQGGDGRIEQSTAAAELPEGDTDAALRAASDVPSLSASAMRGSLHQQKPFTRGLEHDPALLASNWELPLEGDLSSPAAVADLLTVVAGRAKRLKQVQARLQETLDGWGGESYGLHELLRQTPGVAGISARSRPRSARSSKEAVRDLLSPTVNMLADRDLVSMPWYSRGRLGSQAARNTLTAAAQVNARRRSQTPRTARDVLAGHALWLRSFDSGGLTTGRV